MAKLFVFVLLAGFNVAFAIVLFFYTYTIKNS